MIPISSAISGGLVWSKTPHKSGYELKCNGEVVGTLQRKSFWSSEFQAESERCRWNFRRTGFLLTSTEIVDSESGTRIAILKPSWSGLGTLDFSDGLSFKFTSKGFWRPVWTVLAADTCQPVLSIHTHEKTVDVIREFNLSEDRLILLTIFAWHIIRQAAEDAAAAAVVG